MSMTKRFERVLTKQLAMNGQTWRTLQKHGVTEETVLHLDFLYNAPNERAAITLKAFLENETDYDVGLKPEGGFLRRTWIVSGCTQGTTISKEILDQWVEWMVAAGAQYDCEFDGWGTSV